MPKKLSPELEKEIRRLAARGHGLREISRVVKCSRHAVTNALIRPPLGAVGCGLEPITGTAVPARTGGHSSWA